MLLTENGMNLATDTGLPSDQYKRAVLRAPPSRFSVEFLSTSKSNGSYHHGMHISPIMSDDNMSASSRGRQTEYDIWRRWEDCLWLQETLELEYRRAAREKKTRLQQGKGVKNFNGLYKTDMASSWDSLPPGPDPNSVAQNIHDHLPKLSKKGTIFRASQTTIDNRQNEFRNLVETLFSDAMPALIQEIRASTIVTDFFGLWRRDYDLLESSHKGKRNSLTNSVFTSYFSESTPSLVSKSPEASLRSLPNSPIKSPGRRYRSSMERPHSPSESTDITEVSRYPASSRRSSRSDETTTTYRPRRRALSVTSSDSSSTHSDVGSDSGSAGSMTPAIVEEVSIVFGHNPQQATERPSSILEVLPEEREMLSKTSEGYLALPMPRRSRASTTERKAHRSCQIVGQPLNQYKDQKTDDRSIRESWQTTTSLDSRANAFLDGLDIGLPHRIKEEKFRASIASISTFMTTDSAQAVIPPNDRQSTQSRIRISTPLSISDFSIYSDGEDDCNSILDAFPRPTSYLPEIPGSPIVNHDLDLPSTPESNRMSFNRPPSPTPTASTVSTSLTISTTVTSDSLSPGLVSIKAAHNSSIIMLRISRETPLADIRQRLYNKFVAQEGVPLSQSFGIAFVPPSPQSSPVKGRTRSTSVSSVDRQELITIDSDVAWQHLISTTTGGKITIRILDSSK
ncbi:hypothetical protein GALMADRAFT_278233 [Galerina marginata CBS 339.88]|uniref:PX domain-containing protein n=1 Tax=Galerina marginata (strain CBS 339.88) TaxID=685588 RepID=A0A067TJ62_GALM3|nr:hypothetical protein GALMADRAFT_278233 [Galerina marginata CBS 339.88]